jgi:hypothetical protein
MRTIKEIISDLRKTTEWSKPNIKYKEFVSLISELETTLEKQPTSTPTPKVEAKPKAEPKPKSNSKTTPKK